MKHITLPALFASAACALLLASCDSPFRGTGYIVPPPRFTVQLADFHESGAVFRAVYPSALTEFDKFEVQVQPHLQVQSEDSVQTADGRKMSFEFLNIDAAPLSVTVKAFAAGNTEGIASEIARADFDGSAAESALAVIDIPSTGEIDGALSLPVRWVTGFDVTKIKARLTNLDFSALPAPRVQTVDIEEDADKAVVNFDEETIPAGNYILHLELFNGEEKTAHYALEAGVLPGRTSSSWIDGRGERKSGGIVLGSGDFASKSAFALGVQDDEGAVPLLEGDAAEGSAAARHFYLSKDWADACGNTEKTFTLRLFFPFEGRIISITQGEIAIDPDDFTENDVDGLSVLEKEFSARGFTPLVVTVSAKTEYDGVEQEQVFVLHEKPRARIQIPGANVIYADTLNGAFSLVPSGMSGKTVITLLSDIDSEEAWGGAITVRGNVCLVPPAGENRIIKRTDSLRGAPLFTIAENGALSLGGALLVDGGAVWEGGVNIGISGDAPLIKTQGGFRLNAGVVLQNNENLAAVDGDGGAVYASGGYCIIAGGLIRGNSATRGAGIFAARDIYISGSAVIETGGEVFLEGRSALVVQSALTPNRNALSTAAISARLTLHEAGLNAVALKSGSIPPRLFQEAVSKFTVTPGDREFSIVASDGKGILR